MPVAKSFLHKQLIILFVTLVVVSGSVRLIFPPYYNIGKLSPVKEFTAEQLFDEYVTDEIDAQSRYTGKAILVQGRITGTDRGMLLMEKGMKIVRIKLMKDWRYQIPKHKYGDQILVKGISRGVDLTEVYVSNALIITVRQ